MHFASLVLALSTAIVALAVPTKRALAYDTVFLDLNAAIEASDYLTYTLTVNIPDCFYACDAIDGCGFVNTYFDVNGKNGSNLVTCAMFKTCHNASEATNHGGQTQPDGKVDYITGSDGWCQFSY
ncbi:hypothetical protein F5887DRAFT_1174745 [Amanita rubescens]|nr:hypothetical protein F5887DRAFT_1174745 [Amanita rubescens]